MTNTFNFRVKKLTVVTVDLLYLLMLGASLWAVNVSNVENFPKSAPLIPAICNFFFISVTLMLGHVQYAQIKLGMDREGVTVPFWFFVKKTYKWDNLQEVHIGPHYLDLFFLKGKIQIPLLMFKNGSEGVAFVENKIKNRPQVKVFRYK